MKKKENGLTMTDAVRGCGCHFLPSYTLHCLASVGCDRPSSEEEAYPALLALSLSSFAVAPAAHLPSWRRMRKQSVLPSFEYTVKPLSLSSMDK